MQTLYGIRITDRVKVDEITKFGMPTFRASFDGHVVGDFSSGRGAVNGAIDYIKAKRAEAERFAAAEAAMKAEEQEVTDRQFIAEMADKLDLPEDELEELIAVIGRRLRRERVVL